MATSDDNISVTGVQYFTAITYLVLITFFSVAARVPALFHARRVKVYAPPVLNTNLGLRLLMVVPPTNEYVAG